jgi:threonine/homoserine/homoserine lactone efflux protein
MPSLLATILSAFLVTFATVVVPSPSTLALGRVAVADGTRAAAVFLSAVLVLDTFVFALLVFGIHPVLHLVGVTRYLVPLAGAGLVVAGLLVAATADRSSSRWSDSGQQPADDLRTRSRGPFAAGILVNAANPGFWIWWTTVGTSFIHAARQWGDIGLTLLLVAFLCGTSAWYLPLMWAFHHGRKVFSQRFQARLNLAFGIAIAGFGVYLVWHWVLAGR